MLYEKLNYIIAIAEEQNLTKAAKRLFISQPTLTLYVNRLEEELGVKLFNREKSPITLTDAGVYYLEKMKKIYTSEQALRNEIHFIASPSQTLLLGIGQARSHFWLPRILPAFCSTHPTVNIQVSQKTEQIMFEELKKKHLDVVIGALPITNDFVIDDLMTDKLLFAAHKKFHLIPEKIRDEYGPQNPYTIQPEQLNGLPFILPQVSNALYDCYKEILQNNRFRPSRIISFNNLNTGLLLNIQGLGVQLLISSLFLFNHEPGIKNLDFFCLENMPRTRRCIAAFHEDSIKKKLIEDFVETVKNEIHI